MPTLFHHPDPSAPHLTGVSPAAAMPGGEVEVYGSHLDSATGRMPHATIGDVAAPVTLSRSTRAAVRIPEGSISGELVLHHHGVSSNAIHISIAVPMAENLHPVANPAVDADGNLFATLSGSRGQAVPVSIFKISRDFQTSPHVRGLLNPTGLAIGPDRFLYASSRAEGTVYRISPGGTAVPYAAGLGLATGIAFDRDGNLFVGDRSGTVFKVGPLRSNLGPEPASSEEVSSGPHRDIFVFATLEPSIAAYHLAFNRAGVLFVTGPTTSSNQAVYAIDPDGTTRVFFQGLGRPQGIAFDADDNLYVAASLHGQRGIVRITPAGVASLAVSGSNLVGLAFLEEGCAALATRDALYHVDLGVQGRRLV